MDQANYFSRLYATFFAALKLSQHKCCISIDMKLKKGELPGPSQQDHTCPCKSILSNNVELMRFENDIIAKSSIRGLPDYH